MIQICRCDTLIKVKNMDYRIVEVKEDILQANDLRADSLRKELKDKGIFMINVMASPGSGKTTLLTNLINRLKGKYNISFRTISKNIKNN